MTLWLTLGAMVLAATAALLIPLLTRRRVQRRRRDRSRPSALAWAAGLSLHLAVVFLLV